MGIIIELLISFLLSNITICIYGYLNENKKRILRHIYICIIVSAVATIMTFAMRKILFSYWSSYEQLFGALCLSVFFYSFVNALILKQKPCLYDILLFFCMESILIALYSILTYGQTIINSDTATATLLSHSQVENGSPFPACWWYVNGSIWTISISTFVAPFTFLLHNQSLARMLGSATFVLATLAVVIYSSRKLLKSEMWVVALPVFLLFLCGQSDHVLYQGSYTGNMLWGMLIPALAYAVYFESNKRAGFLFATVTLILAIGGLGVFSSHIIPLTGSIIIISIMTSKGDTYYERKIDLKKVCFLLAPAFVGYIIYIILRDRLQINYILNNLSGETSAGVHYAASLDECVDNLKHYLINYLACFGYSGSEKMVSVPSIQNLISILFCIVFCGVIPCLQWKRIKEEPREIRFFFFYSILHVFIVFFMAVFFSLTIERYVLSSIFLFIIISSRYIYCYWLCKGNIIRYALSSIFITCLVFLCVITVGRSAHWTEAVYHLKSFNQQLMDKGLTKGYASYWHAYNNEIYSDLGIKYGAIEFENGKIYEYDWLVDSNVFIPEDKKTFLILEPYEKQLINFDLEERFGQIEEILTIDDLTITIFDHDISSYFYQKGIYEATELLSMNHVVLEDNKLRIYPNGIVFGPADSIDQGKYQITFVGENMILADCDIFSNRAPDAVEYREKHRSGTEITIEMTIEKEIEDIEFRTFNRTNAETIILEKIIVVKVR